MKITTLKLVVGIVAIAAVACNPLGKMQKNAPTIKYTLEPNPLEMHGDSVAVTASVKFPPKYFHKKAVVTVTPSMKDRDGNKVKDFKSLTLVGLDAEGEGKKIDFTEGGSASTTVKLPYEAAMADVELMIDAVASYKSKTKEFEGVKIGDGTIATPLLVQKDARPILGKDNFKKVIPRSISAEINYLVNSSQVRSTELRDEDAKAMKAFIEDGVEKEFVFIGVTTEAYASPDGEISLNEDLANDRANTGSNAVKRMLTKEKVEAANADEFYKNIGKGEDWSGFKGKMEASDIEDKATILRILSMYSDPNKREAEIKNVASTYPKIQNEILPSLRRSQITLNAEERSKTDDELKALVKSDPNSLNIEEILYTATLYPDDMNEQLSIYRTAAKVHATDWRGSNNAGYVLMMQNKLDDAQKEFEKAARIDGSNPIVKNNLGAIAFTKDGDRKKAMSLYDQASAAGSDVNYNKGIIHIQKGDYQGAISQMGSNNTFNAALAKVLNGNQDAALTTLDASDAKNTAYGSYLKAVIGARKGNRDLMISNLKAAIKKDGSLKEMAKKDAEFMKYRDSSEFKAVVE